MAEFKLPNGVECEGKLYNIIQLEEICGKQQNYLINPSPRTAVDHIEPLLKDLLVDIRTENSESIKDHFSMEKVISHQLPIQDIQFIMVKLREITYDSTYLMTLQCPHCNHINNTKIDLSTLEIIPGHIKKSPEECITPKKKLSYKYRPLFLADLRKTSTISNVGKLEKNMMTELASLLLENLGDKSPVVAGDLDALPGKDIEFIMNNGPDRPQIDQKVITACSNPECGKDFEQELPALAADFLLPSRI